MSVAVVPASLTSTSKPSNEQTEQSRATGIFWRFAALAAPPFDLSYATKKCRYVWCRSNGYMNCEPGSLT